MRIASLGSGSKGNATLIENHDTKVLIDLGFSIKETVKRLERLECSPLDIDAILVTHEHSDHIHGVAPFARKFKKPIYLTPGTYDAKKVGTVPALHHVNCHKPFVIGSLNITPIPVPHDAREPCQYVVSSGNFKIGVLTDLGHITKYVMEQYASCDALLLECNHDTEMLANGPYPYSLKQRVAGDHGHLNNEQAAGLLHSVELEKLKHLVISHISEKNNHPDLAMAALSPHLETWQGKLTLADQQGGFAWIDLDG